MGSKTLLTLGEFERLQDNGMRHELNGGELVVMPPATSRHSLIAQKINRALSRYVYEKRIGQVLSEAGYLLTSKDPRILRAPDVSFLSAGRVAQAGEDRYFEGAPELAVEVVSPSETATDLQEKVDQYLAAGSKAVWVVYSKTRKIQVYRQDRASVTLDEGSALEAADLFPGWSVSVAELFRI